MARDSTKVVGAIAFLALYVGADLTLRGLSAGGAGPIIWYPGAGIALAFLVLSGPRWTPLVFVARLLLYWFSSTRIPAPGLIVFEAGILSLAYAVGAEAIRRRVLDGMGAWQIRHAAWLVVATLASAVVAAGASAVALALAGAPSPEVWRRFSFFAAGDASGAIVVLPIALFAARYVKPARVRLIAGEDESGIGESRSREERRDRVVERALEALALTAAIVTSEWLLRSGPGTGVYAGLVCLAPLAWVAAREGVLGSVVVTAVIGVSCAAIGLALGVTPEQVPEMQASLLMLGVVGLFLGTARTETAEREAQYANLLGRLGEGIWQVDGETHTVSLNAEMAKILGRPAEDVIRRPVREYIYPPDREAWDAQRAARAAGADSAYEVRVVRPDGSTRDVLVRGSVVRRASGEIIGSVALVTDVTELRRAQAEGRRSQLLMEAVFRTSRDAMVLYRAEGEIIVDVNDVWCEVTGYTRDEVIGRSQRDLRIWGDPADSARMIELLREHGTVRDFEVSFNRNLPGGESERGYALLSAFPAIVGDDTYVLVSGRDITLERKRSAAEGQLRRLEELGRLAGSVAHDFNNLLTIVLAYTQMVQRSLSVSEPVELDDLREIESATHRGQQLTRRLLAFSRSQTIEPRVIDPREIVERARGMLRSVLGATVTLHVHNSREALSILADPSQFDTILLNLAVNARDAMPNGGALTVTTDKVHAPAGEVAELIGPDVLPGDYVVLRVEDTGVGMDGAVQARMFEPFFTTKPSGNGTGLGLAAVFGIVRQARGAIRATSIPGVGTTFTIFWPAAAISPMPLPPGDETPIESSGAARGGRVLLVEDDDTVRKISRRILEDANFVVHAASDGERALACLEELRAAGTPPDAVLSDVLMPRLGGRGLAEQLGRLYPDLPVILMSGHSDFGDVRDGLANTPFPVLVKPFDVAQLVQVVSQAVALGRESGGRSTK